MKCLGLSVVIIVSSLFLTQSSFAQQPKAKPPVKASSEKSDAKAEAERLRKERQAQARSLLVSLASDARSFRDQTLRARSLARIADALWDIDVEQSRTLFRKAWEAAEIAHREREEKFNMRDGTVTLKPEEVNSTTMSALAEAPDLRREVLRLVAPRDRALSEEFLEKLKESQAENKIETAAPPSLWGLPEAMQQRLSLAENLLRKGDTGRALQLAEPVLGTVTISTLDFLTLLRATDAAAADQRYAAMLAGTGNNLAADANTISLLSSYIFTPNTYVIFNTEGAASYSALPNTTPANVSPQLKLAFFQAASAVLLRPQPPPDQDQSTTGIAGKYMVVKRLLPLFEQHAPRDMTDAMRSQFEALNSLVTENIRQGESESVQKGINEESFADLESKLLDQVEHADSSDERDQLYFKLASLALRKDELKARDYAAKIEESVFRKQAQAWVDWGLALNAISKNKTEQALEINRTGDLSHIQRVWILTQAAKQLVKTDRGKALSLLDAATAEARRIGGSELDRPRGLFAIANALRVVEPARVSEAIFEAVKAANSTEGFTGEGGMVTQTMNSRGLISVSPHNVPDFDVDEIFGALANEDYERDVQLARGFQGEAPRANATIAIARSVLNRR